MLRTFSFKIKIASTLLFLSLGLVVVSAVLIDQYRTQFQQANGLSRVSQVTLKISDFIHEIQKERAKSVLLLNKKIDKSELDKQREVVNGKTLTMLQSITEMNIDNLSQSARDTDSQLKNIRKFVDTAGKDPSEIATMIGDVVDEWIKIQVSYANLFHFQGFETNLISTSIFEKSKESMGRLRAMLNIILAFDNSITPQTVSKLSENITGIMANMHSPGLSISEASKKEVENILKSDDWNQVIQIYSKVVEKSSSGQFGKDPKAFSETITKVIDHLRNAISVEIDRINNFIKDGEQASKNKFYLSLISIVALLIFTSVFSYIIVKNVNTTLITVATNITTSAETVEGISKKIAETSQQLSSSSTQQASALQETTSAIEETSAMINKNAENAKRSTAVSVKSQTGADEGKKAVDNMQLAMGEISDSNTLILQQIEKSNQEISEINHVIKAIEDKTKIINDIVFQTKLLSFNASVEAARAGEHGKGFAVVAEEIGSLAEMSGKSSKEISQLLEDSTRRVDETVKNMISSVTELMNTASKKIDNGKNTTKRCSEILEEIVSDVTNVNTLVSDIAVASQEQARGVEEITKAMVELDSAAQQNNTSAQESASSATELNYQVQGLKELVTELNSVVQGSRS